MTHASITHEVLEKMREATEALEQLSTTLEHRADTLETQLVLTKCVTALRLTRKQRLEVNDKQAIRSAIEDAVTVLRRVA